MPEGLSFAIESFKNRRFSCVGQTLQVRNVGTKPLVFSKHESISGLFFYLPLAVPLQFYKIEVVTLLKVIENVFDGATDVKLMDAKSIG